MGNSNLTLEFGPYSICLELEILYVEGIKNGVPRNQLFINMQDKYRSLMIEEGKLFGNNCVGKLPNNDRHSAKNTCAHSSGRFDDAVNGPSQVDIVVSPPKIPPNSANIGRNNSRRRLRPKSTPIRDPNAIDREKTSKSPRKFSMV